MFKVAFLGRARLGMAVLEGVLRNPASRCQSLLPTELRWR